MELINQKNISHPKDLNHICWIFIDFNYYPNAVNTEPSLGQDFSASLWQRDPEVIFDNFLGI